MNRTVRRAAGIATGALAAAVLVVATAPASFAADSNDQDHERGSRLAALPFFGARIVLTKDGVTISRVIDDSPAADAGLEEGDIVLSINGTDLDHRGALREALKGAQAGDKVIVVYTHAGDQATATITLGDPSERPAPPAAEDMPWVGARLVHFEGGDGVLVRSVLADSPADEAGLKASDVITSIDGTAVTDWWKAREIIRDLAPGTTVDLKVTRGDDHLTLSLTLGSAADAPARPRDGEGVGGPMGGGKADMGGRMGGRNSTQGSTDQPPAGA